jgi:histidinol-phosphate aminotransferase
MEEKITAPYQAASNENPFGVSTQVTEALQQAFTRLHNYPEQDAATLRRAIADKLHLRPEQVLVGSGSAELISLLVRTFCQPFQAASVLSAFPSYPLYRMEAQAIGVRFVTAPLDSSYQFDVENLLAKVDESTKLCFISNPNNPTGTYLNQAQLEHLLRAMPPQVMLVIDEAYIEYVSAPDFADALTYLQDRPNLVVLRNFSKAYGLASLRVGYMLAQEAILAKINLVKQPYNVNQLAQVAALAAWQDEEFLTYTLAQTAAGKQHLQDILQQLGVQYWPSQGNFLLTDAGLPASYLYQRLLEQGIQVRQTADAHTLRISIGQKEHQNYLSQVLKTMLEPTALRQHPALAGVLAYAEQIRQTSHEANSGQTLSSLLPLVSDKGSAPERVAFAYAHAFKARNNQDKHNSGNLYSSQYGMMDMIAAFNVLIRSTPLVTFGHLFSNLTIAGAVSGAGEVHILDLGIGSGLQWLYLLELLANRPEGAPKVCLTGIDIPAPGEAPAQRLQETGERLQQAADGLGLDFRYNYVATKLEDFDLQQLAIAPSEALIVNSAFTLHHIPDQLVAQPDQRDRVLLEIKALRPKVFTLIEPDSEHNKLEFMPRLRESLRHYYTVFEVLDTLLPPDLPERQVIEQEFFGREIINIISSEGSARVERHERNEAWQRRLTRTGFAPYQQQDIAADISNMLQLHEHFSLEPNGAGYTLHWKGTPIVAATAWQAS